MLGPFGEVLLMDWGVARLVGDVTEVVASETIEKLTMARTMDGAAIGTPGFMSPEQSRGELHLLDGRSDVWSLGAVLYELLTLQPAYEAPNLYALMFAVASGPPMDPRERAPGRNIPEELAEVCLRAMAAERADRFATAAELGSAVEAFLEGSKRREAAQRHVAEAEAAWARYGAL
ncbi:MAG: protein kinase, partial [Planctomycetota bacterium]|nr:protein kinase [Planctomycetota bacterium]